MPALQEGSVADAVSRPLDVVRQLFRQSNQPTNGEDDWGVEQYFKALVENPTSLQQIPLLTPQTIDQIPNNTLCRYRGMIQDMMDPEYYVGAFKHPGGEWATAKYADCLSEAIRPDAETVVWDRKPVYCTQVPGISAWCSQGLLGSTTPQEPRQQPPASSGGAEADGSGGSKREREEGGDVAMEDAQRGEGEPAKAARADESSAPSQQAPPTTHAPFPEPHEGDCMVFMYGREDAVKLNDAVEIVGILSRVPEQARVQLELAKEGQERQLDFMEEEAAAIPPTSLVPRIHALTTAKLTGGEDLPLIAYKSSQQRREQVAELRSAALELLASALGGDKLAAEYVLLQLVSRVHTRTEGGGALGLFSLGLSNCPQGEGSPAAGGRPGVGSLELLSSFGRNLTATLANLLPRTVGLPIAVNQLNGRTWRPARDLKTNRLLSAPLQLAENTHLVLDESLLQAGQLTAMGVNNLKALQRLIEEKAVEYDFGFYQLPMPADVPVLVLSCGRSLLHGCLDVTLPLQSLAAQGQLERTSKDDVIRSVRAYLSLVRFLDFQVPQPVTAFLEEELVKARKQDAALQPTAMHTWLTLARLLALSHGDDELSQAHWAEMRRLEHLREQRVRATK